MVSGPRPGRRLGGLDAPLTRSAMDVRPLVSGIAGCGLDVHANCAASAPGCSKDAPQQGLSSDDDDDDDDDDDEGDGNALPSTSGKAVAS